MCPHHIYTMSLFWTRVSVMNRENRDCSVKQGTTGRTDSENSTQDGNKSFQTGLRSGCLSLINSTGKLQTIT